MSSDVEAYRLKESVHKLKEFSLWNEATKEARYNVKPLTVEDLIKGFKIQITNIERLKNSFDATNTDSNALDDDILEFDMLGVGPPIANAIRRILIAEVPTMAIDKIHLFTNTTVIPDEVLTHRLGLIPIKVDPRLFEYKAPDEEDGTEEDAIQFELKVKCIRTGASKSDFPDSKAFNHSKVYSSDLKFVPIGNQKELLGDIRPVKEDILLAVMKPGHEIDLKAFCYKNIGREHAKFSPVVIASYKLLSEIRLCSKLSGERAKTLAKCFPKGVIEIVKEEEGEKVAKVANPRLIECSRNVFLHEELKDDVEICKVKDHYMFTVESAGAIPPEVLVTEAINILREKCRSFLSELKSL